MRLYPYEPDVFAALPDFFVARDELGKWRNKTAKLGEIICSHGLHEVVGVSLLHKHFALTENERIVRRFRSATFATMAPETANEEKLFPYVWRFTEGSKGFGFYPLEFCTHDERRNQRVARAHLMHLHRADDFLSKFAEALCTNDLVLVFGLSGLHARRPFRSRCGHTLLERTDELNRILTLEEQEQQYVRDLGNTTQTLWYFTPTSDQLIGASCASHCYGHCNGHEPRQPDEGATGVHGENGKAKASARDV